MTRKPAAKKAAKKKPAAKKRAASKRPPEPEIQVNRVTETPENEIKSPNEVREDNGLEPSSDERDENGETQADRDAAGAARADKVLGSQEPEADPNAHEAYHRPLEHADFDQHAAEEQRQRELAAARETHNRRTGDASRR
jgi:cell division septation protein DedD